MTRLSVIRNNIQEEEGEENMSPAQIRERAKEADIFLSLGDENFDRAASYINYLAEMERLEDEEDIAACEARKNEPLIPLADVLKELGINV